jgi:hypothetical protein
MMTLSEEQTGNQCCAYCHKKLSLSAGAVSWRPPGGVTFYWFCLVHHLILFAKDYNEARA